MLAAKPVNKSSIQTENNIIELQFDEKYQEEVEISYTNKEYKTFKGKINQEIYKNKMTNFSSTFPQIKVFLKMLVENQIKIKLLSDVKLQLKLEFSIEAQTKQVIQQFELEYLENASSQINIHNSIMEPSKTLNKFQIKVDKYLFNIEFQQNILTISYTNDLYETFIGKIDQKSYEEQLNTFAKREEFSQIGDFFDILNDQKVFSIHFIDEENINFRAQMQMGKKKINIENKFKLEKMKESKLDLALKQLEAVKLQKLNLQQKLQSFEEDKKNVWNQMEKKYIQKIKSLQKKILQMQENIKNKEQKWEKNLKKIYQQYGQYKPDITSQLLTNPISSQNISILTLPVQYRQKMEIFKRLLFHDPKAIVSVFGLANVGKSTLMTQIMHCIDNQQGNNQNRKVFFPAHSSALTFYDSFYVFHQNTINIHYSKDIKRQKVILDEYFENESRIISFFMDDKLNFVDIQGEDLKEIHQNRRKQIQQIKQMKIKEDKFNERFMIIRNNADIMDSQNRKLSYLNKYIALLDRAGFNDNIYTLVKYGLRQREQKQLFKIKNDIVLYCFHGRQIENADDQTEGHLLQLMKTHDFEKIILCVNMFSNFSESEQIKNIDPRDRQTKAYQFIKYMLVSIPKYICNFISKHIESLKKQSKQSKQKIQLDMVSKDERNNLYQQDRTLRGHLNRYGDKLQKYKNILSNFTQFWNSIKKEIQKQLTRQLQDEIEKKLKQYPFQNVHFYGLTRYYDFEFIKKLGILSKAELYKTLGRQSLYSIQKFYFNKLLELDAYQLDIQRYYSDFPSFQRLVRDLKRQDLQSQNESINKIKEKVQDDLKCFHNRIQTLNQELNINIQNEAQSSNDWYIKIGRQIWDKFSSCYLKLQSIITKHNQLLKQHKTKIFDLMFPIKIIDVMLVPQLRSGIISPREQVIQQMVELITKDIRQFFDKSYKIMMKKWNMFVSSASQHLGFLVKDIATDGALSDLKLGSRFNRSKYQHCNKCYQDNKVKDHTITEKQKIDKLLKQAQEGFQLFIKSSTSIISESSQDLNSCVSEIKQRQFLLTALIDIDKDQGRRRMMAAQRRKVQDAINELKLEYTQKLRRINYDMVLHCVTKDEK